jgi:hypothetical protein
MLGRINTEGEFQGVVNKPVNDWITLRFSHHRGPKGRENSMTSFESDIAGRDNTTCLKIQLQDQTPIVTASYNQRITPCLDIGCEGQLMLGAGLSVLSSGFRYSKDNIVINGQLMKQPFSPIGGHLSFLRKVDNRPGSMISYATQLKFSPDPKTRIYKTEWCAAWDYKLQISSVKGHINNNGVIHALYEQRLSPFMSLLISGMADLWNHKYNFGVGLQVVLQELTEEQQKLLMAEEERLRKLQTGGGEDDEFKVPKQPSKDFLMG